MAGILGGIVRGAMGSLPGGELLGGLLGGLFGGGGGSDRPDAPSGMRWVRAWFVGGGEDGIYEPVYSSATILESISTGLPTGRWSNGASRLIPAQALTPQGLPIFADSNSDDVVQEYVGETWSLSAFAGSTTERNATWAAKAGLPGPGEEALEAEASPSGSILGLLLVGLAGFFLWRKWRR
jgi:MYXO-CTERM domain-containing protein